MKDTTESGVEMGDQNLQQQALANEKYRLELERFKAEREAQRPFREGQMRFAELSVRSLLILSGGAALALIAFAANAASKDGEASRYVEVFASAIRLFGMSAVGAVIVAGFSYLSQTLMVEHREIESERWAKLTYRSGAVIRFAAIVIWLASVGIFGWALWSAADGMASLAS